MSADAASGSGLKLTRTQWLICFIATIGFLFDIYELLMLPLIGKDALADLANIRPGTPEFTYWFRLLFFVPAICGGIFGLLGGYLTDLFGRRRVLTFSIILYAVAAFCAGFSTTPEQLLFFRSLVFIGVCVEFVAAVAWLSELFPNAVQREKVLGYTQAFSSVGGLSVAIVNGYLAHKALSGELPVIPGWFSGILGTISEDSNQAVWRYTLMSGLIPAIPLLIIRPFLPESPQWQKKKESGELKRASLGELFSPELKRATIVTTILFALAYGAAFGAVQHMRLIIPKTPEVAAASVEARDKAKASAEAANKPEKLVTIAGKKAFKAKEQEYAAKITKVQEVGGLFGRALMAVIIVVVVSRGTSSIWTFVGWSQLAAFLVYESLIGFGFKIPDPSTSAITAHLLCAGKGMIVGGIIGVPIWWVTTKLMNLLQGAPCRSVLRAFQLPGIFLMPVIFGLLISSNLTNAYIGMFIAGMLVVGQFTFWGNMLPRFFPVHLRGTGESFAANIGGRLIGTSFAFVVFTVTDEKWQGIFPQTLHGPDGFPTRVALTTAAIGFIVFALGWFVAGKLPEPQFADDGHGDESSSEEKIEEEETTAPTAVTEQESDPEPESEDDTPDSASDDESDEKKA